MEGEYHRIRGCAFADDVRKQLDAVSGLVADPARLDVLRGNAARRLKDDALLKPPERSKRTEIDDDPERDQRNQRIQASSA